MIKLGLLLTVYVCLSIVALFISSFTINAWIIYGLILLPFYGATLLWGWVFALKNRDKTGQVSYRLWSLVLGLQAALLLTSPGNCFGVKQNSRCYSNFQILFGNVPRTGSSKQPHWYLVEDAFWLFLAAYCVAVIVSLIKTSVVDQHENETESEL